MDQTILPVNEYYIKYTLPLMFQFYQVFWDQFEVDFTDEYASLYYTLEITFKVNVVCWYGIFFIVAHKRIRVRCNRCFQRNAHRWQFRERLLKDYVGENR